MTLGFLYIPLWAPYCSSPQCLPASETLCLRVSCFLAPVLFFFYSDLIILENKFSFQDFFVNGGLVKIDHFSPFDSILLNLVLLLWLWLHPGLWLVAAFGFPAYCFHAYCWPLPFWRGPCLPLPFWRCPCLLLSGLLLPCLLLPFWLLPCLLLPCVLLPR